MLRELCQKNDEQNWEEKVNLQINTRGSDVLRIQYKRSIPVDVKRGTRVEGINVRVRNFKWWFV